MSKLFDIAQALHVEGKGVIITGNYYPSSLNLGMHLRLTRPDGTQTVARVAGVEYQGQPWNMCNVAVKLRNVTLDMIAGCTEAHGACHMFQG